MIYNYEIGPVKGDRQYRKERLVTGTLEATNYGNATGKALEKAQKPTEEMGEEYGVIRIW